MIQQYSKGIFLKILHSLIFVLLSALLVKYSTRHSIIQVLFFRALIGCVISLIILKILGIPLMLKIRKSSLYMYTTRALLNLLGLLIWVGAVKRLGMNEAVALGYLTPVWLIIAAIIFCSEKVTFLNISLVLLNTVGVVLILQPKMHNVSTLGLVAALLSTVIWAAYDTICKKQTYTEHYLLQSLYIHFILGILAAPFAIYLWEPISINDLLGFSLISFAGVMNIIVLFLGYVYAPIVALIPFSYSRLLFASISSYLLYNTLPTPECLAGAAIILSTELYFYISTKKSPPEVASKNTLAQETP
jgi:drug/metabolite transporter (DMT)-like permease